MVKSLFKSLLGKGKSAPSDAPIVPDVSRVIKLSPGPVGQTATPRASVPLPKPPMADPDAMAAAADAEMKKMAGEFAAWLEDDLRNLKEGWTELRKDANELTRRSFYLSAHNLRGTANTYGYPSISRLCASLCKLLDSGDLSSNMALINLHVEACWAARQMGENAESSNAIANSVCSALEAQVAKKLVTPSGHDEQRD